MTDQKLRVHSEVCCTSKLKIKGIWNLESYENDENEVDGLSSKNK